MHLSENTAVILVYIVCLLDAKSQYRIFFVSTCQMAIIATGAHGFVACGSELASGHLKLRQKAQAHISHSVFSMHAKKSHSMPTFIQKCPHFMLN